MHWAHPLFFRPPAGRGREMHDDRLKTAEDAVLIVPYIHSSPSSRRNIVVAPALTREVTTAPGATSSRREPGIRGHHICSVGGTSACLLLACLPVYLPVLRRLYLENFLCARRTLQVSRAVVSRATPGASHWQLANRCESAHGSPRIAGCPAARATRDRRTVLHPPCFSPSIDSSLN